MKLILKNGTEIEVAESSGKQEVIIVLKDASEFEELKSQVTERTLDGATLNGENLSGMKVINAEMFTGDGNYITAHFGLSEKTPEERVAEGIARKVAHHSSLIAQAVVAMSDIYSKIGVPTK